MRAAHDKWMKDIGDLGGVPEDELVERMWPGRTQPVTADPVIEVAAGAGGTVTVRVGCPTPGASIGYRLDERGRWLVYHEPLRVKRGMPIRARAIRLGYKPSQEVVKQG